MFPVLPGIIGAFIGGFLIIVLGAYIYTALALSAIAKKTKTKNPFLAWIPVANVYLMTQIGKLEWWWTLIAILGVMIPYVGPVIALAATIYIWWNICKVMKKPEWYSLLMLVPVVNLVMMGILAWGK